MRRAAAILGSAVFLVIAPGMLAGYVPWLLCGWHITQPHVVLGAVGLILVGLGLPVLLDSFTRFALQGLGTPAPVFPTRHLIVTGLFRYVRNPMYVAVLCLIIGQGMFFGSWGVLVYGAFVWVGFFLFVLIYEEPALRRSYGANYDEYCSNVPRWIPRLSVWRRNRTGRSGSTE